MGSRHGLECNDCGLQAFVGGGFSVGMVGATLTIWCGTCETLQDAGVDGHAQDLLHAYQADPQAVAKTARCERDGGHEVRAWETGEPCPKCSGKMRETGPMEHWD